jgi:glutaconate CoA-transferase subunit A
MWGITGVQKETVLASKTAIVTVEELVDELDDRRGAVVLPSWIIDAVAVVPGGAHPSYAQDYYERDNRFYVAWDEISRDRELFRQWMTRHILDTEDAASYIASLEAAGFV